MSIIQCWVSFQVCKCNYVQSCAASVFCFSPTLLPDRTRWFCTPRLLCAWHIYWAPFKNPLPNGSRRITSATWWLSGCFLVQQTPVMLRCVPNCFMLFKHFRGGKWAGRSNGREKMGADLCRQLAIPNGEQNAKTTACRLAMGGKEKKLCVCFQA